MKESGWNQKDGVSMAMETTTNGKYCLPNMLHVPFNDSLHFPYSHDCQNQTKPS